MIGLAVKVHFTQRARPSSVTDVFFPRQSKAVSLAPSTVLPFAAEHEPTQQAFELHAAFRKAGRVYSGLTVNRDHLNEHPLDEVWWAAWPELYRRWARFTGPIDANGGRTVNNSGDQA